MNILNNYDEIKFIVACIKVEPENFDIQHYDNNESLCRKYLKLKIIFLFYVYISVIFFKKLFEKHKISLSMD